MSNEPPGGATSSPPPPPYGAAPPRQLKRRPREGHIAGVCAGIAHYFAVDPVIVRIAAAVLVLSGPGVLAYILAWIFVPEAGEAEQDQGGGLSHNLPFRLDRSGQVFGVILLSLSLIFLWGGWWSPVRRWGFPLALLGLGLWLIFRKRDGDVEDEWPPGPSPAWTAPQATPAPEVVSLAGEGSDKPRPGATDADPTDPLAAEPTAGNSDAGGSGSGAGNQPPWSYSYSYEYDHGQGDHGRHVHRRLERRPLTDEERAARRRRRMVFPTVMGALLVWVGLAFLAGVGLQAGLAVALCIVGLGFVLGALIGGGKLLVLPALLLTAALIATSVLDLPLDGPVGKRHREPVAASELDEPFQVSMGEQVIDLTHLDFEGSDELTLEASVGIGHLEIRVPDAIDLEIRATAEAGDIHILGVSNSGVGVESNRNVDMGASGRLLVLDLEVGLGQIEVVSVPGATPTDAGSSTTTSVLG